VPNEDDFEALETRLQPIEVWVTYINAINEHEALNNAGAVAAWRARVVTGLEEEGESKDSESPSISTWTKVYAPPLDMLTRNAASMKTPGRPNHRVFSHPVGNDMNTEDDIWQLDDIEALVPDPLEHTSNVRSELLPKWGELMAQNWNKLRKNLWGIGQVLTTGKDANWENFESINKELSAISNKIAVLDTRIGVNPTASGMVSVWEAVEDLMGDGRHIGIKLSSFEKRQVEVENATIRVCPTTDSQTGVILISCSKTLTAWLITTRRILASWNQNSWTWRTTSERKKLEKLLDPLLNPELHQR
jgi:hypothetical protein